MEHTYEVKSPGGRLSRVKADSAISRMLISYGLTHIHLQGYTVKLGEPITTPLGCFPVTHIEAKYVSTGPTCPRCGGKPGYLEGDTVIVAGCQSCGTVFRFKDMKEVRK